MNLQDLVDRMITGDVGAFDQVVKTGAPALPPIVQAIEGGQGGLIAAAALARLELPDRISQLTSLIHHQADAVQSAAVRALAIHPDPGALAPLAAALDADHQLLFALRAVGDLGDEQGVAPIKRTLARRLGHDPADRAARAETVQRAIDDIDPTQPLELLYAAEALAKLGDFSLCEAAVELATFDPSIDIGFDEAGLVRLYGVRALDVMIGSGIVVALDAASRGRDREVADAATRATLHLGRTRAVADWIQLAKRDDYVAETALACLERLVGERPSPGEDPAAWWKPRAAKFKADLCYSFGEPATPAKLVERSRARGSAEDRTELAQMTGCAFLAPELDDPPASVIAELDKWWAVNASRFTPGKLHRWGRTYEPDAVE